MVVAWTYAAAVNFVPSYRDTVDKVGQSRIGIQNTGSSKDEESGVLEKEKEMEMDAGAVHIEK